MGFKCPVCYSDFGTNKSKWENHIKNCNDGLSLDFVKSIIKIAETKSKKIKAKKK